MDVTSNFFSIMIPTYDTLTLKFTLDPQVQTLLQVKKSYKNLFSPLLCIINTSLLL